MAVISGAYLALWPSLCFVAQVLHFLQTGGKIRHQQKRLPATLLRHSLFFQGSGTKPTVSLRYARNLLSKLGHSGPLKGTLFMSRAGT